MEEKGNSNDPNIAKNSIPNRSKKIDNAHTRPLASYFSNMSYLNLRKKIDRVPPPSQERLVQSNPIQSNFKK